MATVFEFAPSTSVTNGAAVPANSSIYDIITGNVTYDTGVKFQDLTASARCLNDSSAVATLEQTISSSQTTRYFTRVWRRAAFTSGTFTVLTRLRNTSNAGLLEVRVNSSGQLILRDSQASSNFATSTTTVAVGSNFRYEVDLVGTALTMRIYGTATSGTVSETLGPFTYANGSFNQVIDGIGTTTGMTTMHLLYAADGDTSNPSISRWASSDTTAPTVPGSVVATPTSSQVTITWAASTDANGVASYRVRRGGVTLTGAEALTTTSFVDTDVTVGSSYTYTVSAVDAAGNRSAESSSAGATISALPPGVKRYCIVAGVKQEVQTRRA
jgi:hypothetical protein